MRKSLARPRQAVAACVASTFLILAIHSLELEKATLLVWSLPPLLVLMVAMVRVWVWYREQRLEQLVAEKLHAIRMPIVLADTIQVADDVDVQLAPHHGREVPKPSKRTAFGVLDLLGSETRISRVYGAVSLVPLTAFLALDHVRYVPWATGTLAILCALDAVLIHHRVRTRRYGDSPLELLELAEWIDCDPDTPRGRPLHGDIFERAAEDVASTSEALA